MTKEHGTTKYTPQNERPRQAQQPIVFILSFKGNLEDYENAEEEVTNQEEIEIDD